MKIYRISHTFCYLDIGHNENSEAWGFSYDDNWITTEKTWDDMGNTDLHGNRDDFEARGRIDHNAKKISLVVCGYIDEEGIKNIRKMLMQDYPGYTIYEF